VYWSEEYLPKCCGLDLLLCNVTTFRPVSSYRRCEGPYRLHLQSQTVRHYDEHEDRITLRSVGACHWRRHTTKKDRIFSKTSVRTSGVQDKKHINTCAHVRVLLQSEQVLCPFNFLYMFSEEAKLNFLSFEVI